MLLGLLLGLAPTAAHAADDPRMIVDVLADEQQGPSLRELHADVRHAAGLALKQLWQRLVPQSHAGDLPGGNQAVRFMQRAQPTPEGMRIVFHADRVKAFLRERKIPFIAEPPTWNLEIRLRNAAGLPMNQSAQMLREFAEREASRLGYVLDSLGESLVLQWRWLDRHQVALSVRGTSRLGEMQQTRTLAAGDPLPQLESWLLEILMQARDAAVIAPEAQVTEVAADIYAAPATSPYASLAPDAYADPYAQARLQEEPGIRITIHRRASLPEQVLFEQDLSRDPRVAALIPTLLGAEVRQYRLLLANGSDDGWLAQWLAQHGLNAQPTPDGWLAQ